MVLGMNLTKGGLTPAKLINLTTNEEHKFMFNPTTYTLVKTTTWERAAGKGVNVPETSFSRGEPMTLTLDLHFDSYADNEDVRKYTNPLWKMMLVEDASAPAESGKSTPPAVAFEWGQLYFKAVITSMTQNFTMFASNGMPVRAKVTVNLTQHKDDASRPPQSAIQTTVPATRLLPRMGLTAMIAAAAATAVAAVVVAAASDRIDHVAQQSTGDSGNMRQVAERNNVDNPLRVRSGQTFS